MTRRRVLLLGVARGALRALVADVLGELGVDLTEDLDAEPPDAVLVLVDRRDLGAHVRDAQDIGAPVVAMVDSDDDLLIERVRRAGVRNIYALGRPLAELQAAVERSLLSC